MDVLAGLEGGWGVLILGEGLLGGGDADVAPGA